MDTSGRQRRTRRPNRGRSDFATFDEIALFSNALVDGGMVFDSRAHNSGRLQMLRILSAWARAVGPHLKAVAQPASCREGRVMVEVRDAGWKRELERARPEILARMIRLLPEHQIREISFRLKCARPGETTGSPDGTNAAAILGADAARPRAERVVETVATPADSGPNGNLTDHLQQVMSRYLARSH